MGARPSIRMIEEGVATLELRKSHQGASARVQIGARQVVREGTKRGSRATRFLNFPVLCQKHRVDAFKANGVLKTFFFCFESADQDLRTRYRGKGYDAKGIFGLR